MSIKASYWDTLYKAGKHKDYWDLGQASPELVACILSSSLMKDKTFVDMGCGT